MDITRLRGEIKRPRGIGHGIAVEGLGDLQANLAEEPAILTLDTREREFQEWREIVIGGPSVVSRFISASSDHLSTIKVLF